MTDKAKDSNPDIKSALQLVPLVGFLSLSIAPAAAGVMWWVFRPPTAELLKLANLTTKRAAG